MGQGQGAQHTRDTIVGEQFRQYCDFKQGAVNRAFEKCVETPSILPASSPSHYQLSAEEQQCTEEYAAIYATFVKTGFIQFTQLYEMHQRDMYERARLEAMQSQARNDLKRGK